MRTFYLLLSLFFFSFSSISCKDQSKNKIQQNGNKDAENMVSETNSSQQNKGIKYFESIDNSLGIVSSYHPFPVNWKESKQAGFLYEGPGNIRVSGAHVTSFQFTHNQEMAWMWQQQGLKNVPPMPLEQIIETFFSPIAKQTGRTLTKTYELPDLANTMFLFNNQLFVSVPTQKEVKAYGLEWKDNNGLSYLTTLIINISYSQASSAWWFSVQYMEVSNSHFEKAKKAFLYGLTNVETNPQWILVCNQRDAKRAGQAYQAHLGRMAIINARSNTSKSVGDVYSEILDINHAGYLKRSDMKSAGHSNSINTIGERVVIANTNTGENYNVQAGSKFYWVNSEGKYFGTDNSLYDPRTDNRLNNTEWEPFEQR